jgi:hypothetical protein
VAGQPAQRRACPPYRRSRKTNCCYADRFQPYTSLSYGFLSVHCYCLLDNNALPEGDLLPSPPLMFISPRGRP